MALTTWAAYQANNPEKAQQLTQVLLCIKGIGVNENYVLEADSTSGGLPITVTPTPVIFTLNGADQEVTEDTGTPANDRPLPVKFTSAQPVLVSSSTGRSKVGSAYNDYTGTPVTTAAYTQVVASTASASNKIQIFDSSGETMILATGAGGSEVDLCYIFPGGLEIDAAIPAGTRLSIKAKTADATTGYFAMNLWG